MGVRDGKQYGDDGVTISELVVLSNEGRRKNNGASLIARVCHPPRGHRRYIFLGNKLANAPRDLTA